uniref:Uncharacterized protein n=1 Tax=Musa acuminata subsp. malaccensis TaxID=214687 RepID=A0A804I7F3_MUSAM
MSRVLDSPIFHHARVVDSDNQMLKDLPALHCGTEGLEILPSTKSCHNLKVTKSCTNLEA